MHRFLALGDSYTIGEGLQQHESWPYLLKEALKRSGIPIADPEIIAQTGWTAAELEVAANAMNLAGPYDLIFLMVGVNDQYRGHPFGQLGDPYMRLIQFALSLVDGKRDRVICISIPDWGVTPFARDRNSQKISETIDAFNRETANLCRLENIKWVSVTDRSRELSIQTDMLVADGLHPSRGQYQSWVQCLLPFVLDSLSSGAD